MTDDIVHEATYPYPPSVVWRALTRREAISSWLMESSFAEATVGHKFQFRDKPRLGWSGVTDCEIIEVIPEKRIVYTWGAPEDAATPPTRVTWEIAPAADGGTRVTFRHTGFLGMRGWMMRAGMNNGWWRIVKYGIPYVLARLDHIPPRDETKAQSKILAKAKA